MHATYHLAPQPAVLSAECLGSILRVAGAYAATLPANLVLQLKAIETLAITLHPSLSDLQPEAPVATPLPEAGQYAQDVEQEATALLQLVYTGEMSVPEAVNTLQRLKTSGDARERVVFDCVLHSLLDEYRFLVNYPPAELQLAAQLFGQLVRHRLVSSLALGVALKYVRDALRAGPTSPMAVFGVTALRQFATDLPMWPQYVRELATVPALRELAPDVADALAKVRPFCVCVCSESTFQLLSCCGSTTNTRPPIHTHTNGCTKGAYTNTAAYTNDCPHKKVNAQPTPSGGCCRRRSAWWPTRCKLGQHGCPC